MDAYENVTEPDYLTYQRIYEEIKSYYKNFGVVFSKNKS